MVVQDAVYCTLLLSDNYLPGAMVLAHSLRDNGSQAKLVALYTPDTLQPATINELQTVYDKLIPVYRMTNHTPANLWLMERPDLIATFTKIELWRQTQFKRIVYIDSDVVSIRAPDELLDLDVDFAAAPDVGWPDCFNSGVMVLRPNMQDYFALKALAERGISFDGADQGLLNMHFRDWHRLSFTYNCTPSANYQYIPAYKHFESTIRLIHFIGSQKPWNMPRQVAPFDSPYNQLLARWWTIYDRHYRPAVTEQLQPSSQLTTLQDWHTDEPVFDVVQPLSESVPRQYSEQASFVPGSESQRHQQEPQPAFPSEPQPEYHARGEFIHETAQASYPTESTSTSFPAEQPPHHAHTEHHSERPVPEPVISVVPLYVRGEEHVRAYIPQQTHQEHISHFVHPSIIQESTVPSELVHQPEPSQVHVPQPQAPMVETQRPPSPPQSQPKEHTIFEAPQAEWDASREPPPLDSKPEGFALETKTYTMSEDHQLFQPPTCYPEAPKNMYYQVPDTKPQPQKLTQLFPWEMTAPKPTRVFADNEHERKLHHPTSPPSPVSTKEESRASLSSHPTSWTSEVPSPSESWDTYSRSNAWDEVPEIQQYIHTIQQARKGRVQVQVLSGGPNNNQPTPPPPPQQQQPSLRDINPSSIRITDFPSALERPSLPVTPAPIHRLPATGSPDDYNTTQLPAAEGVPNQEDWNPLARLEALQRRQSDVLDNPDSSLLERLTRGFEGQGGRGFGAD
ncbi:nucleotide-diphospho-sugar transferase [Aspergillus cavernicola]|uniref:Nucleotide-diphospho-sugar transferase n=1 Tax=Aspergillus cavernicola TaxID=176166 RepID=A0ABR4IGI6_9EURO